MNKDKRKFSILISGNDPEYQFLLQVAISEIDPGIEINQVYNSEQLLDFFIKDDLQRDLNRQVLPDLVIAELKNPFSELGKIKETRTYMQLRKIPVYLFTETMSDMLRTKALEFGATEINIKPYTFIELKAFIQHILDQNFPGRFLPAICCRCEDVLDNTALQIKLSVEEKRFIVAKFEGNLCLACLNQLKTSYRIINGDYNINCDNKVIF